MSQIDRIRAHLGNGKAITPMQALRLYGCFRLAAVIFKLKEEGFLIDTEMVYRDNKKWASYTLTGYAPR
jgi:hypothetical protein